MNKIIKGFKYIGSGIVDLVAGIVKAVLRVIADAGLEIRKWRLRRATAYVNKYGYEIDLNSRVKMGGRSYYVMSYDFFEDVEKRREVRLNLIGVSQYKEILRRTRTNDGK